MNDAEAKTQGMNALAAGLSWKPRMMNGRTGKFLLVEAGPWCGFRDDDWPDFRDPPTMGWLLHQVREAWGDRGAAALHSSRDGHWTPNIGDTREPWAAMGYASEAGSLIAALEHAPKRKQ